MKIYVDADACPNPIKDNLYRTVQRVPIETILVANQRFNTPRSPFILFKVVSHGFDEADKWIVDQCQAGDIVILQGGVRRNRGTVYNKQVGVRIDGVGKVPDFGVFLELDCLFVNFKHI